MDIFILSTIHGKLQDPSSYLMNIIQACSNFQTVSHTACDYDKIWEELQCSKFSQHKQFLILQSEQHTDYILQNDYEA